MRDESELRYLCLCTVDKNKRNGREVFPAVSFIVNLQRRNAA